MGRSATALYASASRSRPNYPGGELSAANRRRPNPLTAATPKATIGPGSATGRLLSIDDRQPRAYFPESVPVIFLMPLAPARSTAAFTTAKIAP